MKIKIAGTKTTQYLDGEYEGKIRRIISAQEIPGVYDRLKRYKSRGLDCAAKDRTTYFGSGL